MERYFSKWWTYFGNTSHHLYFTQTHILLLSQVRDHIWKIDTLIITFPVPCKIMFETTNKSFYSFIYSKKHCVLRWEDRTSLYVQSIQVSFMKQQLNLLHDFLGLYLGTMTATSNMGHLVATLPFPHTLHLSFLMEWLHFFQYLCACNCGKSFKRGELINCTVLRQWCSWQATFAVCHILI